MKRGKFEIVRKCFNARARPEILFIERRSAVRLPADTGCEAVSSTNVGAAKRRLPLPGMLVDVSASGRTVAEI
jgi:hypothetical protein